MSFAKRRRTPARRRPLPFSQPRGSCFGPGHGYVYGHGSSRRYGRGSLSETRSSPQRAGYGSPPKDFGGTGGHYSLDFLARHRGHKCRSGHPYLYRRDYFPPDSCGPGNGNVPRCRMQGDSHFRIIQISRAALNADRAAEVVGFFLFGTNNPTQMAFGYSRDGGGVLLPSMFSIRKG